jgi:hypothetical protein
MSLRVRERANGGAAGVPVVIGLSLLTVVPLVIAGGALVAVLRRGTRD